MIPLDGSILIKQIEDCIDCSLESKIFRNTILVFSFILVHLSSRFIILDLSPSLLSIADAPFLRRASIFAIIFLWTRSILWTLILTAAYFILFFVILSEDGYLISNLLKSNTISPFETVSIPAIAVGESNTDTISSQTQLVEITEDNIKEKGDEPVKINARTGDELSETFRSKLVVL